jgi:hypothetical protein
MYIFLEDSFTSWLSYENLQKNDQLSPFAWDWGAS